ncbi:MAG: hypothetical protein AB1305_04075 [Candidatus Hadarchaeota archaeon]
MSEKMPPGLASRVAVSAVVFFGWLIFLVLHLAFYASNFSIFQNLAIVIISILVGIAILAPMWIVWGIKHAKDFEKMDKEWKGHPKKKSWIGTAGGFAWAIFLVIYLWFYAGNYNIYQNLAAVIVAGLIICGVTIPIQMRRGEGWWHQAKKEKSAARKPRRKKK